MRSITDFFAIHRLRTQTNGATKRVSKEGGFQVTLPIDYTLEYVPKREQKKPHTHAQPACVLSMSRPDGQLIDGGTSIEGT
jgi:hypothetical protein